jgi:hypothetical protein
MKISITRAGRKQPNGTKNNNGRCGRTFEGHTSSSQQSTTVHNSSLRALLILGLNRGRTIREFGDKLPLLSQIQQGHLCRHVLKQKT